MTHSLTLRMSWRLGAGLVWIFALASVGLAWAQPATGDVFTIPRIEASITVDGILDEAAWQQGALATGFSPYFPVETGTLEGHTEARIFYDDTHLYLGFRCQADDPDGVRAHIAPREVINEDDQIGIYLDTFFDHRTAFVFYINALGIQQEARVIDGSSWNMNWDTVFDSAGRRTEEGFEVEVAIPFRSLRFPRADSQTWGLILTRKFAASGVKGIWPDVTRDQAGMFTQMIRLEGIEGVSAGRNLEIQPSLVAALGDTDVDSTQALPFPPLRLDLPGNVHAAPSASIKYGLTTDLTLDATLNPDFSQVESDPFQFGNQRFALFFSERRPFFLEGVDIFDAPWLGLYSRSVVAPRWGVKVTGKQGGNALGAIVAQDAEPAPTLTSTEAGETPGFEDTTGSEALVAASRVVRDIGPTGSQVAAALSTKQLFDDETGAWRGQYTFAASDVRLLLGEKHRLDAQVAGSLTGDPREGDAIQLKGGGYTLRYRHQTRTLYSEVGSRYLSRGFRAENGYLPRPGWISAWTYNYVQLEPDREDFYYVRPEAGAYVDYDPFEGAVANAGASPGIRLRFAGQTYLSAWYSYNLERWEGIAFHKPGREVILSSQNRNAVQWELGLSDDQAIVYDTDDPRLAGRLQPRASATVRPAPRLRTSLAWSSQRLYELPPEGWGYGALAQPESLILQQNIYRLRADFNFTAAWSIRALLQRGDDLSRGEDGALSRSDDLAWSLLFTWLPHPGTAAYLGANQSIFQGPEGWQANVDDLRIFFKFSYLWRV